MTKRSDGRWQEKVTMPNGTIKYFYGKTKSEVTRKIAEAQTKTANGRTMSEAADAWFNDHSAKVEFKTAEGYASPLKRIKDTFGKKFVKDITPSQISAFISKLEEQGFSRSTVQRQLTVLKKIFNYEINQHDSTITNNPCASVELSSGLPAEVRDLPAPEDVAIIKLNVNRHPFGLFPYFLALTGMRPNEALAITDKDFDFEHKLIHVKHNLSWQNSKRVIKNPKTKNGIRDIVLLDALLVYLPRWKGYLFSGDGGKSPLSSTEFRNRWQGYCKAVGLADAELVAEEVKWKSGLSNTEGQEMHQTCYKLNWTYHLVPYQLRHEFCTMCFDAHIPEKDVQHMMGHSKIETTHAIYEHIRASRAKASAEQLNSYVNSIF